MSAAAGRAHKAPPKARQEAKRPRRIEDVAHPSLLKMKVNVAPAAAISGSLANGRASRLAQARRLSSDLLGVKGARAQLAHRASGAGGLLRAANAAPVEDQRVRQRVPQLLVEQAHQVLLDLDGLGVTSEPEALADALHVRVDDHAFGLAEGDAEHDVRRLAPDAGQFHQLVEAARYLAAVLFDEQLRETDDVLRLLSKHADLGQHLFDLGRLGTRQLAGSGPAPEQLGRELVDHHVRALGGEHGCDDQLERASMLELAMS